MGNIALAIVGVVALWFAVRWRQAARQLASLSAQVTRLAKWETVADAADTAKAMLDEARAEAHYALTPEAEALAVDRLNALHDARSKSFANARTVRSFFERMLERQSNRLASDADLSEIDLVMLEASDIPEIRGIG